MLVSGYAEDEGEALFIHQTARIFGGRITKEAEINHMINHQAYILASQGSFELQDEASKTMLYKGDGAEVSKSKSVTIRALDDCEIILIDAPVNFPKPNS